jgi:transcriptional regulator with XRE-family HTH domain
LQHSSQKPLRVPDGFWEREDVRAALDARDFRGLLVLVRRWTGGSQFRIALTIGLTPARVSKIINGRHAVEKFELIERVADGLAMPDEARMRLGLAPRSRPSLTLPVAATASDPPPASTPMDRPDHAGTVLDALIRQRGLTHEDVAARLGIDLTLFAGLAHGGGAYASDLPNGSRSALEEYFGLSADDLLQPIMDCGVPWDPMRRRTFVSWGLAAAAAAAGLAGEPSVVGRPGLPDVDRLHREMARLYALDYRFGGDTLWHAARALVAEAYAMLEQGARTEAAERLLLSAAGQTQMCAGWLALDAGRLGVARVCHNEALALAHQGRDTALVVRALANLAFGASRLGRPREALRLAEAASRVATGVPEEPHIAAIPLLRQATAHAMAGDAAGCYGAIRKAREVLDRHSDVPPNTWYSFLSPAEIDGMEGTCAVRLGDPKRAERLLEQAIRGHSDDYRRTRALYRVWLARARLNGGAADGAVEAANSALDDLAGQVASWRVRSELDAVAGRLRAVTGIDGVAAFLDRYSLVRT